MSNFSFSSLIAMPHCGKEMRKYIYIMGVSAVVILTSTYIYEYVYLESVQSPNPVAAATAVNQLRTNNMAGQFASPGMGLGVNVAQPPAPIIGANVRVPGNHRRDGRDKLPCAQCHQIRGQGRWTQQVAFMTQVNQDPRRGNANNPQNNMAQNNMALNNMNPNNNGNRERENNRNINGNNAAQMGMNGNNQEMLGVGGRPPFAQIVENMRYSIVNINSVQTTGIGKLANAGAGGTRFADPLTGTSLESLGSGIIVSRNGHVLTNYHVIRNATAIFVTVFSDVGSKRYAAEVVKQDEKMDLALVKIQPDDILIPAPLGDSDRVQVADSVIAIGSPFGLDQTVSRGIISGLRKSIVIDKITHARLIQTDAAINTGNSGGALVARDGTVIGVNTAIYTPTGAFSGIGFAVPMKQAKAFMADVPNLNNINLGQAANRGMGQNNLGQNIAAVAAPPIRGNSTPPGSHQDGRSQMACTTCHQVRGAGPNNQQGNPVAFTNIQVGGVPLGLNVARGQGGPRILAGTPTPHRDGREKMDCNICHQVVQAQPQAQNRMNVNMNTNSNAMGGTGFMQPLQEGINQFAAVPMVVAGGTPLPNTAYFEGATIEPITSIIAQRINTQVTDGAFVSSVYPNTAAEKAGLKAGDIIFKLNGRWVLSPEDLLRRLSEYQVGDNLRLGIYTGGQRRNLYLVLSGQIENPRANIAQGQGQGNVATVNLPSEMNWLGLELKPITPELAAKDVTVQNKKGTLVSDVDRNAAGELAGIQKGDIVKRLNGLPVNDIDTLDRVINTTSLAQGILFLVERNGRDIYITVKQ